MDTCFFVVPEQELCKREQAGCDIVTGFGLTYEVMFMTDGTVKTNMFVWE